MRIFLLLLLLFPLTAFARPFEGVVQDQKTGRPLPEARVRVQGSPTFVTTAPDGKFSIEGDEKEGVTLTAWHHGYFNGGVTAPADAAKPLVISLQPLPSSDNKDYRWVSPDPPTFWEKTGITFWKTVSKVLGNEKIESRFFRNCSNCHGSTTIKEWQQDAHSQSAVNPILLTSYNGTSISGEKGVFPGYRLDFPNSLGNCAACHAPVAAFSNPFGADLNALTGVARHGVSCDVCHKVGDVELHPEGGFPGILSMKFRWPPKGEQVFLGPRDDAIAGPDSHAPIFGESRFCAPCHSAKFWNVPIYSEYDEWLKSPYAAQGVHCQDCHMAPNQTSEFSAPPEQGGIRRDPGTVATHINPGSRDPKFLSQAVTMKLKVVGKRDIITASIILMNGGAGHHLPTGVPMRNMILLVAAKDVQGKEIKRVSGPTVPSWGGEGPIEEGNYSGLPGKGFAKILADASKKFPFYDPKSRVPTPHWRQSVIVSDTRIPAKESDASEYRFQCGDGCQKPVTVTARLIYRRAFKEWIDAKGWPLEDSEIARGVEVVH